MTVFNPQTVNRLEGAFNRSPRFAPVPSNRDERRLGQLESLVQTTTRWVAAEEQRRKAWRDAQFVSSSRLAFKKFDFDLRREALNYYRSDGSYLPPKDDYRKDMGFGVSLSQEDFTVEGRVRPYVDFIKESYAKFQVEQLGKSPSVRAKDAAELKLKELELQGMVAANKYANSWALAGVGSASNEIVRSFRQQLGRAPRYDGALFYEHVDSLAQTISAADGSVDRGALMMAFRKGLSDMVQAGVVEAAAHRNNAFGLKVLAQSTLRDSPLVSAAIAGLPYRDRAYLAREREGARDGMPNYFKGQAMPQNKDEVLGWALAQISPGDLAKVQERAIKAFEAQTQIARNHLRARVNSLRMAVALPATMDMGYREEIKESIRRGMGEAARLYPREYFPSENAMFRASLLAASEVLESRGIFNEVPTYNLSQAAMAQSQRISQQVLGKLGANAAVLAAPLQAQVWSDLQGMATQVGKVRREDPYGAILGSDKSLRVLEQRLSEPGAYANLAERASDQQALRDRVLRKAIALGVAPTFLTGQDRNILENLATVGNSRDTFQQISMLKDKYGTGIFYDFIAPALAQQKSVAKDALVTGWMKNPSIAGLFIQSQGRKADNLKALKGSRDLARLGFMDIPESDGWENLKGMVEDKLGVGAASDNVLRSMQDLIHARALDLAAQGRTPDAPWFWSSGNIFNSVVDEFIRGMTMTPNADLGKMEFREVKTLRPPGMPLNEARLDLLEEVLVNPNFIRQRIAPRIMMPPRFAALAQEEGLSPVDVLVRTFQDEEAVRWSFMEDALIPLYVDHLTGLTSAIREVETGLPFKLGYDELPALVVTPGYQ